MGPQISFFDFYLTYGIHFSPNLCMPHKFEQDKHTKNKYTKHFLKIMHGKKFTESPDEILLVYCAANT